MLGKKDKQTIQIREMIPGRFQVEVLQRRPRSARHTKFIRFNNSIISVVMSRERKIKTGFVKVLKLRRSTS